MEILTLKELCTIEPDNNNPKLNAQELLKDEYLKYVSKTSFNTLYAMDKKILEFMIEHSDPDPEDPIINLIANLAAHIEVFKTMVSEKADELIASQLDNKE